MEEQNNEKLSSRRELLKKVGKTAAFVVPTLVTFQVSTLSVSASTMRFNNPYYHPDGGPRTNTTGDAVATTHPVRSK